MTIPGVKRRTAELLIAEIGVDMDAFPTPKHLASWAGVCPGNDESAGKRPSGKTRCAGSARRGSACHWGRRRSRFPPTACHHACAAS
jgi:transposase